MFDIRDFGNAGAEDGTPGLLTRIRALYEATPLLVGLYDPTDRLRYANPALRATFGIPEGDLPTWEELVRRSHAAGTGIIITAPDFETWLASAKSRRGKVRFRSFESDLRDGRWLLVNETLDADGWMLTVGVDVTSFRVDTRDIRQARDHALRAAHTDELTGVANRRFAIHRANEMMAPDGPGGALCVIDLDNFKRVNDRFGHQTGDDLLRAYCALMAAAIGRADCFGRVGGEEFMLVLPQTDLAAAERRVCDLLARVRASRPLPALPDFTYTFSAGLTFTPPGDTFSEAYGRADRALYLAKLAGRDRVMLG
ncbi:sensor domain-containing diguanylate cyclase [Xanthobacter wiegelii]|uniref:sensor domain-containing diguanylate cyclase n=1 Tax=Xanthobacter wiegelii TaxID=3119913 RepID=UPI0037282377